MALRTETIINKPIKELHHPLERVIKNVHKNNFRHAHNTVNNPHCSIKKNEGASEDLVKFTIIGNRVTKEFIYCEKLVKGLHKYRRKIFDAPEIRGVTTVEWPKVWNDLKLQYGGLAYCLESQVAVILNDKFIGGDKELREIIESRYHYHQKIDYYKEGVDNFVNFIRTSQRSCVYMHISIDSKHSGTLIFMLYIDLVPYTCENFLRLCRTKRGGYGGTPIHRIVKDGWIQCGGFGLKNSDLDCENFIVPHDKRGVLCMANDGRHKDCSTQFFVLLQPAPWMDHKYVAFGQLIDGEETLRNIEIVPTFYESPTRNILIDDADILNLECHDISINKNTNKYINGHIENLNFLGELLYENLLERVFLNLELRLLDEEDLDEESEESHSSPKNIRATQRFIREKEDIEKLQKSQLISSRVSSTAGKVHQENNDFDVEVYEYEPEESSYQHVSLKTESLVVKPEKPFYIPLTDVPYPGEVDSTYDLKKFLKGDYCLESDLRKCFPKRQRRSRFSWVSEAFHLDDDAYSDAYSDADSDSDSYVDLDADSDSVKTLPEDEVQELKRYIKLNVDRVSFAGEVIRGIGRGFGKHNIFEDIRRSDQISDDELRRYKLACMDRRSKEAHDKKVALSLPLLKNEPHKIKRRQTGFVRMEDIKKISLRPHFSDIPETEVDNTKARTVRIAETSIAVQKGTRPRRKQTDFVRPMDLTASDTEVQRHSALTRLYDNITNENESVLTLKEYKPPLKTSQKKFLFTTPLGHMKYEENYSMEKNLRPSITLNQSSFEHVLNIQHGRKTTRKISSDYIKTIDQIEQKPENSIRCTEFAKTRPSMTVSAYQQKNILRTLEKHLAKEISPPDRDGSQHGLRLPGDTPLYSFISMVSTTNNQE